MMKLFAAGEPRPPFIPGLDLAEGFFTDLVRPLLEAHLPDMRYSAAVLAGGSDVLGFDTEMSMDHDWGPRVMLFLEREDFATRPQVIRALAMEHLPLAYRGYPHTPPVTGARRHRLGLEGARWSPCHGLSPACGNAQCTRTHAFGPLRAYASGRTPLHNQPSGDDCERLAEGNPRSVCPCDSRKVDDR